MAIVNDRQDWPINGTVTNAAGSTSLPQQFCQKCGGALGTAWAIVGGLNFHPRCAPETPLLGCQDKDKRITELEAELAALKARRCATCKHFDQDRVGPEWGTCDHEKADRWFTVCSDFGCRYWVAREEE